MFKDERLVGAIGDHRVGPAGQQVAWISLVRDARHRLIVDAFALQHRGDVVASRRIHQRSATQIDHAADVRPTRDQDDGRGMLEYGGQHDQPTAGSPVAQNACAADAEICGAAGNGLGGIDSRATFSNSDVETGVAVEALLKRLIVACELKLMLPLELNRDRIERCGRLRSRQRQRGDRDQPSQQDVPPD